jgi:predicted porin
VADVQRGRGDRRWGIKGNEDLGGGLQALFDLESGFVMDNGQTYYGTRLFGYQAYVGLQSDALGTLTFGRQFDTVTDAIGLLTANGSWAGYLFSHPFDNDNTDATFHASNSVKFTSNTYGGFSGTALYGFSNEAGGFAHNRVYGVGLKYSYKTFSAGAVFEALSAPGSTAAGSVAPDDAGFAAADQKIYGIGASYGIGPATLGVVYTHTNIGKPTSAISARTCRACGSTTWNSTCGTTSGPTSSSVRCTRTPSPISITTAARRRCTGTRRG